MAPHGKDPRHTPQETEPATRPEPANEIDSGEDRGEGQGSTLVETDMTTLTDGPAPVFTDLSFRRGDMIGRYIVLEPLGAGGMGVVYAAYDPQLDRRIAIKLIRPRSRDYLSQMRARLLREAQALAKLDDPHVLKVYDVGTKDGRVFLATEFVAGSDLSSWLEREKRSQAEILYVFQQAGRGLAAAHAAGMVHRDFKPSNVMVRDDGRAVVLDFGLARTATAPMEDNLRDAIVVPLEELGTGDTHEHSPNLVDLTEAGALLGTPAYMAPEQWAGDPVTAAADQFSFCIALYRALYRAHPFERPGPRERPTFKLTSPPEGTHIPSWLRRLILRGLERHPKDRYPSMAALLRDLRFDPARRRRRLGVTAAGLIGATLLAIAWPRPEPLCTGSRDRLATVWNGDVSRRLEVAFSEDPRPYARDVAKATLSDLDALADRWSQAHREACEATHIRKEQSTALLDQRMACLEGRRREMGSLVQLFLDEPTASLDGAVRAISSLSSLEACADVESMVAMTPPPTDPEARDQLESIQSELAEARALYAGGRYARGLERLSGPLEQARELTFPPLLAEALVLAGSLHAAAGDHASAARDLEESLWWAGAGRHDRAAAEAFVRLIRVAGYQRGDIEAGKRFVSLANTVVERVGTQSELAAALADHEATLALQAGETSAAAKAERRAVRLKEQLFGDDHPALARSLIRLGNIEEQAGRVAEARDLFARAFEIQRRHLGSDHPEVAMNLDRLGAAEQALGQFELALEHHLEALEVLRASLGDHPHTAAALTHLGNALVDSGKPKAGAQRQAEALQVYARTLGEQHPHAALARSNLATALVEAGELEQAREQFERTLDIQERIHGQDHPWVATTRFNLAELLNDLGQHSQALALHGKALGSWRTAYGEEHPLVDRGLVGYGRALTGLGRDQEALEHLEDALERLQRRSPKEWVPIAQAHFALAQCLWRLERRPQALVAGKAAQEAVTEVKTEKRLSAAIATWLEKNDVS